ncbi:MAG: ATP-dependent zinc metalloprotease FtsH [Candidatus Pacebacteria bacterium]|nr:ATP-dependent zinc metalloprotease FtsH [Candidatus Paceibacterota bacterium]
MPPSPGERPPGQQQKGPDGKLPRPPIQTFLFWIIILFALPLIIFFIGQQQGKDTTTLIQSEFESYLKDGHIRSATVIRDPNTGVREIKGTYIPKTAGDAQAPPAPLPYKVEVTYTEKLDELVREYVPERETKVTSNFWGNILISLLPILLLVGLIYFLFSRQLKSAGRGALQFGKSRARLMSPTQERVTFDDVAGADEAKEEVQEIVEFLSAPEKFRTIGGKIPKGVLMIGPPGTGKTLLARAIAGEAGVPFFSISGSDFVEMFVGVGASRVRDMFQEGKRHAPCLIFIDEIDAVGRSRFSGIGGGHDEREQTLNALLSEMDGFEPNAGIIVLAATNRPDVLDPALMRPGRFDRRIAVDLRDTDGGKRILEIHIKKIKLKEGTDLAVIAKGTPGFSGADLANLINEAALRAAREGKKEVQLDDLEEARDKVRWGKERRSRTMDEKDRKVTAVHEAGHTLVGLYLEHGTPLHKVTIIPRGQAYLGATMSLPEKDRYTQGRTEIEDELVKLMGGRIAEILVCKDVTTGAAMDLKQATEISRRMVCEWGMSEKLGPLSYGHREEHIYLGRDITRSEDYSEETAREIDTEIRAILDRAHQRARNILEEHFDQLELLGNTLLEKETLTAVEIRDLLGMPQPTADEEPANGETERPIFEEESNSTQSS